ncbi:MAG: aminodeoxychorismate synthase component I [Acidimicrobiales bacterium]
MAYWLPMTFTAASGTGDPLRVRRALVRHEHGDGRRWLAFADPVDHFTASTLDEVGDALDAAEAASRAGHWVVGFVSYDAAPAFDPALRSHRDPGTPLVAFAAFADARPSRGPAGRPFNAGRWVPTITQDVYETAIRHIRELIAAGETYQVNYTLRLHATFEGDPEGLFAALCRAQRADHLAFVDLDGAAVCSASPELFLRRTGDHIETRPMKGTRPRHPDPVVDRTLADELLASEKDRSENTMIVDMARNDLGRVAHVGSVLTTALHTVESYPTVHQLTSTVTARTDCSLRELFDATFPGASITGAPKVATSHIIHSLESEPRGVYTGAVGLIEPGGDAEFNIAIRTAWVDRRRGTATYGVGGGIVWDSDETAEWHEAHDKARVLHRATRPFRLLETLAWEPGAGPILLDRHMRRLADSAAHFGFDCDVDEVTRRLGAIRSIGPLRLRVCSARTARSRCSSRTSRREPHPVAPGDRRPPGVRRRRVPAPQDHPPRSLRRSSRPGPGRRRCRAVERARRADRDHDRQPGARSRRSGGDPTGGERPARRDASGGAAGQRTDPGGRPASRRSRPRPCRVVHQLGTGVDARRDRHLP